MIRRIRKVAKTTKIEKGDLLYTSVGSYGNPAIIEIDRQFCFQRYIAHLKPKNKWINIVYLDSSMQINYMERQADRLKIRVAQKTLNLLAIRDITIPLPSLSLQNQFAERIQAIEKQKELINQSIADTQLLFDYTMDKYFN